MLSYSLRFNTPDTYLVYIVHTQIFAEILTFLMFCEIFEILFFCLISDTENHRRGNHLSQLLWWVDKRLPVRGS